MVSSRRVAIDNLIILVLLIQNELDTLVHKRYF